METIPKYDYRVISELLTRINHPRSLSIFLMLKYKCYEDIVKMGFNPLDYNDVEDARLALLSTDLLRKHEMLPTGIDKDEVALKGFFDAELECQKANYRLLGRNAHAAALFKAQRKIAAILGRFDPLELLDLSGWGPGSTLKIKRKNASPANKFRQKLESTPALASLLQKPFFQSQFPNWDMRIKEYEGNKVITVPKNAKTNRVIAVEPSGNLYFQKGIGAMIRKRLRSIGVDLSDQGVNQKFAHLASLGNDIATVDFSAASDTISYRLVLDLLPFDWFQVLDLLRSPRGYVKSSLIEYEKFSSMGNGYTFELESLIFYALAYACADEDDPLSVVISVYGDDLIYPSKFMDKFVGLCNHVGFKVNTTKSYSSGYYRESCGHHYWDGHDITPIYLRRFLKDSVEKMHFHNRLVELSMRTIGSGFRDKRFKSSIKMLRHKAYPLVPFGYGDIGFITSFDEATPIVRSKRYQRGFIQHGMVVKPYHRLEDDAALLTAKLFNISSKCESSGEHFEVFGRDIDVVLPDRNSSGNRVSYAPRRNYILKKMWFPDWPGLGQII